MRTIPIDPILQNERLRSLNPDMQHFVVNALFLLARDGKLTKVPNDLRLYFHCSQPTYSRFKDTFKAILAELIPEIIRIKQPIALRALRATNAHAKKSMLRNELRNKKETFSDENDTHQKISLIPSHLANPTTYHKGQSDHVSTQKAKKNNATGEQKLFTDD